METSGLDALSLVLGPGVSMCSVAPAALADVWTVTGFENL